MNQMTIDTNEVLGVDDFASASYLDYSMYVIMDRALPNIGDGLKPVHRRLLYAMSELRLDASAKYKKSARTVGDTLGKFHPHGDTACYEAMVLMAQPFSTRIPLVDGQGNWGSIDDPKSFAAMRYTEAKLTQYAASLLNELKQDTVDWKPNFDGTLKEPSVLPAQLPNILINGGTGIAVGMATDIPPHNINEVVDACILMLSKPKSSADDILDIIQGPDYPCGGDIITAKNEIKDIYKKGRGSIKLRASYEVDGETITITSIPYQSNGVKALTEIAAQIEDKKYPLVTAITDASDELNPFRIELTMRSNRTNPDDIMNYLFATTCLESSQKINLNMIGLDGRPQVKGIEPLIREWCQFRQNVFERKKRFRLKAVNARLHILEGLLIAYLNLDDVIRIIREDDDPKKALMVEFKLSEEQASAILELKLRQLGKLEEHKLNAETDELRAEKEALTTLLADDVKIKRAVISELKSQLKSHSSERRTQFKVAAPASVPVDELISPPSNVTIVLSEKRWWRSLKGHDVDLSKVSFKHGDGLFSTLETRSNLPLLFMSATGRFFSTLASELPNGKSVGEPMTTKYSLEQGDTIEHMLPYSEDANILLTTSKGNAFFVPANGLVTRAKKGKEVLKLTNHDTALTPIYFGEHSHVIALTQQNRIIVVDVNEINVSSKSQGVKLIDVKGDDFDRGLDRLVQVLPISLTDTVEVMVGKRKFNITPSMLSGYVAKRARRGTVFSNAPKDPETPIKLSIS